ncbi:hypothetical protein BD289DRAFT_371601 [Coniella lustricola]|uniref:Uncharacterized protein n=1 Tax=Coniella lustricola TaxID=2025994 RepID=A0A2T3A3I1_9PEZI|nr:hypothetical protein BD289DRAFT_371601 [Coniella lustricola]
MAQFDWFLKIGATQQAVNVLNDQPYLFTVLIVVLLGMTIECLLVYYIHWVTLKPEQRKKKAPAKK